MTSSRRNTKQKRESCGGDDAVDLWLGCGFWDLGSNLASVWQVTCSRSEFKSLDKETVLQFGPDLRTLGVTRTWSGDRCNFELNVSFLLHSSFSFSSSANQPRYKTMSLCQPPHFLKPDGTWDSDSHPSCKRLMSWRRRPLPMFSTLRYWRLKVMTSLLTWHAWSWSTENF